jgi:hypothetical protein
MVSIARNSNPDYEFKPSEPPDLDEEERKALPDHEAQILRFILGKEEKDEENQTIITE